MSGTRKMLILGALPLPYEGPWVPLGIGVWTCDFKPELAEKVQIEIEDHDGKVHTHNLSSEIQVSGRRARALILEEFECGLVSIGVVRIR